MKKIYFILLTFGFMTGLFAQDPHLSMFYSAPLQLNPALTGVFNGNYRVSGLYRSQWGAALEGESGTAQFRTMTFAGDFRIPVKKNSLGVGLEVLNDQAGAANFGTTRAGLALSYMQSLDKWSQHYLVVGLQGDLINRTFSPGSLRLGGQWDGAKYNPNYGPKDPFLVAANQSRTFYDASVGLLYFYKGRDKKTTAYLGFSVQHLNEPNESFVANGTVLKLNRKYSAHGGVNFPIADQVHLLPKFLVQFQGQSFETLLGTDVRFIFDKFEPSGNALRLGAMFRGVGGFTRANVQGYNPESIVFLIGLDIKGIDFGVSYDLNISQFNKATYSRGGFEVSLIYVGKINKRSKDLTPCPKF